MLHTQTPDEKTEIADCEMLKASVLALLVAPAASLQLPQVSQGGRASAGVPTASLERRSVLQVFGAAAALALPAAAFADTLAELDEPMKGFGADEQKRAAYQAKQKAYKKAWRKELSNLEYMSNDAEAIAAIKALTKLVKENGMEIPQGIRKQDLDQVYKRVKPQLGKEARLAFLEFDNIVRRITTVQDLKGGFEDTFL